MARYSKSRTKNGITSYETYYNTDKIYKRRDNDMYFMAQEGDRCDILANKFYGDVGLWWYIARVNSLKSMNIPAGTTLRIPAGRPTI